MSFPFNFALIKRIRSQFPIASLQCFWGSEDIRFNGEPESAFAPKKQAMNNDIYPLVNYIT